MNLLEFDFMQRALLAALLVGLTAPAVGIYLVQRRLALMGDGIGHVAFAGVAAGFATRTSPLIAAVVAAAAGALAIEWLRSKGRTSGDVALSLIFYGGIATGAVLAYRSGASVQILGYLFGSVLTVTWAEVGAIGIVAVAAIALSFGFRKQLFAVCYDEDVARVAGLPVGLVNMGIAVVAAVTIAVTMRVVGILLVSAMLVLPVATAQQMTRSFRTTLLLGSGLGGALAVLGVVVAYQADLAPGATIVLTAIVAFALASLGARLREH